MAIELMQPRQFVARGRRFGRWLRDHSPRFAGGPRPVEATEIEPPSADRVRHWAQFSKWTGILAVLASYHVLVGWFFNIGLLTRPEAALPPTTSNEALTIGLAGVALYVIHSRWLSRGDKTKLVMPLGGIVAALGLWSLLEHAFGRGLGLDQWPMPGRMAVSSALAMLMIGVSLICLRAPGRSRCAEALGLIAGAMSLLAGANYLYEARPFAGEMPPYSAALMLLLSAGVLSARADQGFMLKVTSDSFGGLMARRLLPASMTIPILLGWLQHLGQEAGLYTPEPGLAAFAVVNVMMFVTVVWWGVNSLYRMDTKRRRAERELKATAAMLSRSNADLEQFAYVASHDLKEPLRAISGSVQILQQRFSDSAAGVDDVLRHTVEGARRMQTIIDDLLTYSRLTTREGALAPVDFTEVLHETLANLETQLSESGAIMTVDPLPVVKADRTQMVQVFQNLVSNAIKYRSERIPKIHVYAEEGASEWVFAVRDNGIGIAKEYAGRIFRIFQRLHTRHQYPGTGIGLAICKKIVERHSGRIWVESEPEVGSTFYFTLPK